MRELVWYASYGSNLLRDRFMKYINGGVVPGATFSQIGCEDKSPPINDSQIIIPNQVYFSQKMSGWENQGIAFIEQQKSKNVSSLGRMYLITQEQFEQIVWQENHLTNFQDQPNINFEKINQKGFEEIPDFLYGRIVLLGSKDSFPIYTFTANWNDTRIEYTKPGMKYIKVIANGIRETYSYTDNDIVNYLSNLPGINSNISKNVLRQTLSKKF